MAKKKKPEFLFGTKHTWESEETLIIANSEMVNRYAADHKLMLENDLETETETETETGTETETEMVQDDANLKSRPSSAGASDESEGKEEYPDFNSDLSSPSESRKDIDEVKEKPVSKNDPRPYKCNKCEKDFITSSDLTKHHRVHTGDKPFMCRYCGRCFSIRSNLKVHLRSHTGEKPFECELCDAEFAYTHSLNRHVAVAHPGYEPQAVKKRKKNDFLLSRASFNNATAVSHRCHFCGLIFQTDEMLSIHMKSHTGTNPYQIVYPQSLPAGSVALQVPPNTSSSSGIIYLGEKSPANNGVMYLGEKSQAAPKTSEIIFVSNKSLLTSTGGSTAIPTTSSSGVVHLIEKGPFPCGVCGKVFTFPHLLESHMKFHDQMYICNKCDKQFAEKEKLIEHQKTHEKEVLKCTYCGEQLKDKKELVNHHRKHAEEQKVFNQSLACPVCSKIFSSEKYLASHMTKHQEKKPWQCEYCMFKFFTLEALNAHRATHMGDEEPYICEYCDEKFMETSAFVSHMKSHACDESCKCKHCAKDNARTTK